MQPLKVSIEGDFWDCQIYRGRLYAFYMDGSLAVYDWNKIITSLHNQVEDSLPIDCAFRRGNYLYGSQIKELFNYHSFKQYLIERFNQYTEQTFVIENSKLSDFELIRLDNPFVELPNDTEIFDNKLYAVTDSGFSKISVHTRNPLGKRVTKFSDGLFIALKASKGTLALSGGDEGLFEFHIQSSGKFKELFTEIEKDARLEKIENNLFRLSSQHSSFVNWSFASLYSSSYVSPSFLAAFGWREEKEEDKKIYKREFKGVFSQSEIFTDEISFCWGLQEKIYKADTQNRRIDVVSYIQSSIKFDFLDSIQLEQWQGDIIGGGTAYFGVIIELENSIVVVTSNNNIITIPRTASRWRVYPRSRNYENHLHIITDQYLEVYSFNHDYFVSQDNKVAGIRYVDDYKRSWTKVA